MIDDPFGDFRIKREKREKREAEVRAKEEREKIDAEKHVQRISQLREAYDEVVTDVLEKLRQAAFPNQSLSDWSIGEQYSDEGFRGFSPTIIVELIHNSNDDPVRFDCYAYNKELKTSANLSRDGLVVALKQLVSKIEKR